MSSDLVEELRSLNEEFRRLNAALKLQNSLQLLVDKDLPLSPYWTWFQKPQTQSITVRAQDSYKLIDDKELPSSAGYMHSLDLQVSSGNFLMDMEYYDRIGTKQTFKGHLVDFWVAEFSPRLPASAGDPLVVNRASDAAASFAISATPEWAARVSPNFNLPFNTPFKISLINDAAYGATPGANATIYGFDLYFLMLTQEAVDLVDEAKEEGLLFWPSKG